MNVKKEVWILAEQRDNELEEITLELVSEGRKIADKLSAVLCVVIFSEQTPGLTDSFAGLGINRIYAINDLPLRDCTADAYVEALFDLTGEVSPDIMLCGTTTFGSDIAVGLAARLETGLVSDCIYLDVNDEGLLIGTKPVYNDRLQATIVCSSKKPQIATLSPGVSDIPIPVTDTIPEVITVNPEPGLTTRRARVTGTARADLTTVRLDQAEVIVSGGRGIGGPEGFTVLQKLAELLGGCIGASLVATDNGWVSEDKHIGQTGVVVAPKLYLAAGISGSIYHTMGMKDSKVIIAINKDRNAPIFKLADMGIIGDWRETVTAMISYLEETEKASAD
jgi:electron transfer flavoprotein alpha subunit